MGGQSDILANPFVPLRGSERGPPAIATAVDRLGGSGRIEVS